MIEDTFEELIKDPYFGTELIVNQKGLRKKRIANSSWRIYFCIVEECHKEENEKYNGCRDRELKEIIVWTARPRKEHYSKARGKIKFEL